jgi:hypothetical protein
MIGAKLGVPYISSKEISAKAKRKHLLFKQEFAGSEMARDVGRQEEAIDRRVQDTLTIEHRICSARNERKSLRSLHLSTNSMGARFTNTNISTIPPSPSISPHSIKVDTSKYSMGADGSSTLCAGNGQIAVSSSPDHKLNADQLGSNNSAQAKVASKLYAVISYFAQMLYLFTEF